MPYLSALSLPLIMAINTQSVWCHPERPGGGPGVVLFSCTVDIYNPRSEQWRERDTTHLSI